MLLGQFSVTVEYRPGSRHANVDGFPVSAVSICNRIDRWEPPDFDVVENGSTSELVEQPFAESDLLPELSGKTWLAATLLDEATGDLPPSDSEPDG